MPVKSETQFGDPTTKKPFTVIVEGNIGRFQTIQAVSQRTGTT